MQLDLRGQTVTQAIAIVRQALDDAEDTEFEVITDSEVVKLNLSNAIAKLGYQCRFERKGASFVVTVKTGKKSRKPAPSNDSSSGVRREISAFPAKTVDRGEVRAARQRDRERRERRTNAPGDPVDQAAPSGSRPTTNEAPQTRTRTERPTAPREPAASTRARKETPERPQAPRSGASGSNGGPNLPTLNWLVVQHEQIGDRDARLGTELLADFLDSLDLARFQGVFLVHRGVRLIDPTFQQGRFLKLLEEKRFHIWACSRSLAYYQLEDKVKPPIQTAQIADLQRLTAHYQLIWI